MFLLRRKAEIVGTHVRTEEQGGDSILTRGPNSRPHRGPNTYDRDASGARSSARRCGGAATLTQNEYETHASYGWTRFAAVELRAAKGSNADCGQSVAAHELELSAYTVEKLP
jgi:hypothetical protein